MNEQKTQIILFITFETEIGMRLIYIFVNKRKNDKTFYHCLPKEISDKMQRGGSYLDGCGVFESVTMLYASNHFR